MKIALIQMRSGTDVQANVKSALKAIKTAAAQGAELIATPEMTHLLQKDADDLRAKVSLEKDDPAVKAFARMAEEFGVHILAGSLAIKKSRGKKVANRSYLFSTYGEITATYDKIHLFEAAISDKETYKESDTYAAGESVVIAPVGDLQLGLSICYDVRFAAHYKSFAQAEADMIAVPAAFTTATGKAHWETLLRARAIETGAYVIAPAQGGKHADGRKTWGRSMVVDPWGEVIAKLDHDKPGILYAKIDPKKVTKARARIPAWRG